MSHFTVMIIGPDHEAQLQPFHEFECTGCNDQYVVEVDQTEEFRLDYQKYGEGETFAQYAVSDGRPIVHHGAWPDIGPKDHSTGHEHRYGYTRMDAKGEVVKVVNRTNPNAKWDWYVVGGRWCGYFPLKSGRSAQIVGEGALARALRADPGTGDQVLKGDVDFERARADKGPQALVPFAVLKDGTWHEQGSMGWFGMVSGEREAGDWANEVQRLYDDLPNDTILTLVDCHI